MVPLVNDTWTRAPSVTWTRAPPVTWTRAPSVTWTQVPVINGTRAGAPRVYLISSVGRPLGRPLETAANRGARKTTVFLEEYSSLRRGTTVFLEGNSSSAARAVAATRLCTGNASEMHQNASGMHRKCMEIMDFATLNASTVRFSRGFADFAEFCKISADFAGTFLVNIC